MGSNVTLNSMTAFSSADGGNAGINWRWDIRSVNARGLDLRLRLPGGLETLETRARNVLQQGLSRGSVNANLTLEGSKDATDQHLNESATASAINAINFLRAALERDGIPTAPVQAEALLALPGMVGDTKANMAAQALEHTDAVLRTLESTVTQLLRDATGCAEDSIRALRERIEGQLAALLKDANTLEPGRLEQEVAVLATKADIREELDRLSAHLKAAHALLEEDAPVGRRLEFLTQEFNREANTLCSKAATDQMTRIGLDLKAVIDQIREQAANVE